MIAPRPRVRKRRWPRRLLLTALALALLAGAALFQGLVVRTYQVKSAKLDSGAEIRLVVLTDLHGAVYGERQEPIVRRVAQLRPDAICLVGDMVDDRVSPEGTRVLLEQIAGLAPTFYVTGSHEYWSPEREQIVPMFTHYGVTVLQGQTVSVTLNGQRVAFSGLNDPVYTPNYGYDVLLRPFENLDSDACHILLSHRPDPIETFAQYGFDLVLSGHTHGGQVRVPFLLNGLYAPDQGWFPPYAGGLYQVGGSALVVSRGLSYDPQLPRVFNPPEIVLVRVTGP